MKSFTSLLFAFLLFSFNLFAQGNNKVTKPISVNDFNTLELEGAFDVVFKQGSTCKVFIEGKEKDVAEFKTIQDGKKLRISNSKDDDKNGKTNKKDLVVFIQFEDLEKLETTLVGEITNEDELKFNTLTFENTGVGTTDLKINCKELNLEFTGVGKLKLSGNAITANLEANGVGSVDARDLVVRDMVAECNGIGNMKVNAYNTCKISANGLGSVKNYTELKE
ncbi:head GIN domain-containing protein [Flammeovirga sp. SubArs3]|uniref:head GIN domain-containing protein n=1 Tax=Flammeovirga sp. SubArs3 TaxID=2995316 RepID=UPI00248B1D79|nr:head GIN domain-containing protein [Flammeovirga sp. SubArs3]